MRNFLIEAEASEPAISKMHPDVADQTALTRDAVQVSDQENANDTSGSIDGRPVWL